MRLTGIACVFVATLLAFIPAAVYAQSLDFILPVDGQIITSDFNATWVNTTPVSSFNLSYTLDTQLACAEPEAAWQALCSGSGCTSPKQLSMSSFSRNSTTVRLRLVAYNASGSATDVNCTGNFTLATVALAPRNFTAQPLSGTSVLLAWNPKGSNELVDSYTIYKNGQMVSISGSSQNYTDSGLVPLVQYNYTIAAQNPAGLSQNSSISVTLQDSVKVNLVSPADGAFTNSTQVLFICNATGTSLTSVSIWGSWSSWSSKNALAVSGNASVAAFNISVPEGSHSWSCMANSTQSFAFSQTNRTLTVDYTAPNVSAINSTINNAFNPPLVAFYYSVADQNISSCSLFVNSQLKNSSSFPSTAAANYLSASLQPGSYNWTVICNDAAGNSNSTGLQQANVTSAQVTVTVNSPSAGKSWTLGQEGTIEWSYSGFPDYFQICYAQSSKTCDSSTCGHDGWLTIFNESNGTRHNGNSFGWKIPSVIVAGTYAVRLEAYDENSTFLASKCSPPFSILGSTASQTSPPSTNPAAAPGEPATQTQQQTQEQAQLQAQQQVSEQQPAEQQAQPVVQEQPAPVQPQAQQPSETRQTFSRKLEGLTANSPATASFDLSHLKNITIFPKADIPSLDIILEIVSNPSNITAPSDFTLEYFEITANDPNHGNADISFAIPRSELDPLQIDYRNIVLYHMENGNWVTLPTYVVAAGNDSVAYLAKTQSFSMFAIGFSQGFSLTGLIASKTFSSSIIILAAVVAGLFYFRFRQQYFDRENAGQKSGTKFNPFGFILSRFSKSQHEELILSEIQEHRPLARGMSKYAGSQPSTLESFQGNAEKLSFLRSRVSPVQPSASAKVGQRARKKGGEIMGNDEQETSKTSEQLSKLRSNILAAKPQLPEKLKAKKVQKTRAKASRGRGQQAQPKPQGK